MINETAFANGCSICGISREYSLISMLIFMSIFCNFIPRIINMDAGCVAMKILKHWAFFLTFSSNFQQLKRFLLQNKLLVMYTYIYVHIYYILYIYIV